MKAAFAFLILIGCALSQVANFRTQPSAGLNIEVRASSSQVEMTDEIVLTVTFRSPQKQISIWNALGWGATTGLSLKVFDSSGREVQNNFAPFYHPLPPDETGKDALLSIGGNTFAGFDSRIPVSTLFPKPGRYTVRCVYGAPLRQNYFRGNTIWGKEDGTIVSPGISISVR